MERKPLAIDLYCGLGGWTEGLLAAGYDVIGFDNERHEYGDKRYPARLVLQDVLTLHGSWFNVAHNTTSGKGRNPDGRLEGIKQGGTWFHDSKGTLRSHSSKSKKRKEASATIAKIPFELARWIGRAWLPQSKAA